MDPAYLARIAVVERFFTGVGALAATEALEEALEATEALEEGCAAPRGAAARGADPAEEVRAGAAALV